MKRLLAVIIILLLGLCTTQAVMAMDTTLFTDVSANGKPGLIDFEDTGDYIVMIQIRLRELGYFHFKATGRFQGMTRSSVIAFQQNQMDADGKAIISDGTIGQQSIDILFSSTAARSPIAQSIPYGPPASGSQKAVGELVEWNEVKSLLTEGNSYEIMDFNTGQVFEMVFVGGEQHAEMECKGANDTIIYKQVFGEEFNYSKRPMLLIMGEKKIACSLQGAPHGTDTVSSNDMSGHACLYFSGSKSHVGMLADIEHNNYILTAAGRA